MQQWADTQWRLVCALVAVAVMLGGQTAGAADAEAAGGGADSQELAKKLQNPVASLISVPFQHNFDFGLGPDDDYRYTLNVQPVIPISLTKDWNLISRTILPVIYQPELVSGTGNTFGLGDTTQSLFLSPVESPVIWGVGPVMLLPTATDDLLGGDQWGAGPTGVALKQSGHWTYGILANHIWSFGSDHDHADVNATFLQPFGSYTTKKATSFTLNTESTYDWTGSHWTIPFNLQVSQVLKLGKQPVSIGLGGRYYAEAPAQGPEWGIRLLFVLLFPKG